MFGKKHSSGDELRSQLQDDIRRCSGFMQAIVQVARGLDIDVPPGIVVCCDAWSGWHRSLAAKRPEVPREDGDTD
jgi:hypothetical protein